MLILKRISVKAAFKSTQSCSIATTAVACKLPEIQMRIPEIKMRVNPNSFGPLTNLPDYSYMDGRPTPMGTNQFKRYTKQREMVEKIITISDELDFAKERYERNLAAKAEARQKIISDKLKPKGHLLLKK